MRREVPASMRDTVFGRAFGAAMAALLLVAALLAAVPAGPAHAEGEGKAQSIAIEITAPSFDGAVSLGGEVGRTFEVESLEDPCWVRVRPELALASSTYVIEDVHAAPAEPGWVTAPDGWSYWTAPLSKGEIATFSTSFTLSHDTAGISDARAGESMRLRETGFAEAIQAEDTFPDFSKESPWEDAYKGPGEPAGDVADTSETKAGANMMKTGDPIIVGAVACAAVALLSLLAAIALMVATRREAKRAEKANMARQRKR